MSLTRPSIGITVVYPIPYEDPVAVFAALRGQGMAVFLDSASTGPDSGRYSVIAIDPVEIIEAAASLGFDRLKQVYSALPIFDPPAGWPIGPGLFGSLGYELRHALEDVPSRHLPWKEGPADLLVGLFDSAVVFDVIDRRAAVIAVDIDDKRSAANIRAHLLAERIAAMGEMPPISWAGETEWTPDHTPADYQDRVGRILDYIRAGDIYQANFTQRWIAARPDGLDAFTLYRRLRALSPAPYAAFIEDGRGNAILSASPERFLCLTADRRIDTRPIKGTRPRGLTPDKDRLQAESLRASEKDRAENLMIVDLLRNDLGRVAETGSVAVPELNTLYSFSSVHHLVSTVTARLKAGCDPIDLIGATFPGGSITGTPKIRAMEIIDELETGCRGHYCGAIGWIGLDHRMELSIAIRILTLTSDNVTAQAGGGIVADSDPVAEYEEALTKARPLLATLSPAYR